MTANEQSSEEYYEDIIDRHLRNERNVAVSLREDIHKMVNDIYTALGSGHSERVYHNAMEVCL